MGSPVRTEEPAMSGRRLMAIIVAVIVVAAAMIGYVLYLDFTNPDSGSPYKIASGDLVTIDYIGRLPDGKVFDTSIYSVVLDDAVYPKSLTFSYRSNESYEPLSMTAGDYGPGGTIEGFAMGVIGMSVGDHRVIEVPPDKGYAVSPSMTSTIPLMQELPIVEIVTVDAFFEEFNVDPVPMDVVQDSFYDWDVLVTNVSGGFVHLRSQPALNSTAYPYGNPEFSDDLEGWNVKVVGYDTSANDGAGVITLQHMIGPEDVYNVKGVDSNGYTFVLSAYDSANETFRISYVDSTTGYNGEIAGRTLYFEVTIISVLQEDPYS